LRKKKSECFDAFMLRQASAERKNSHDIKTPPFVLSEVEGLLKSFSATC
jgi:hypothetical protein